MLDVFFSDLKNKRKMMQPLPETVQSVVELPTSLYEKQNPYDSIFSIFSSLDRSKTFRYYEQTNWIHIINSQLQTIKDIYTDVQEYSRQDLCFGKRTILYVFKLVPWTHQDIESIKTWLQVSGGGTVSLGGLKEETSQPYMNFHEIEIINKIFVAIPQSPFMRRIIDRLAKLVAQEGSIIE